MTPGMSDGELVLGRFQFIIIAKLDGRWNRRSRSGDRGEEVQPATAERLQISPSMSFATAPGAGIISLCGS